MRNIDSLKNVSQFKNVYSNGKSFANRYLVLYVLDGRDSFRLGISVSKKVGNSVTRHRVTRFIRESYMAYKQLIPGGCHIIVVARSAASDADFEMIKSSFGHLLKKHGLI